MKSLISKFSDSSAVIGIFGLGYVGLPLAVDMGKRSYEYLELNNSYKVLGKKWLSLID